MEAASPVDEEVTSTLARPAKLDGVFLATIQQASTERLPYDRCQKSHIYRMHFLEAQFNREPGVKKKEKRKIRKL